MVVCRYAAVSHEGLEEETDMSCDGFLLKKFDWNVVVQLLLLLT